MTVSESQRQVLVVEDSSEDRELYRRLVNTWTAHVNLVEVVSGREGLNLYRNGGFDCVLLDYNLPDLDGLEFLECLALEERRLGPPVLMLTGAGSEDVAVKALKSGAFDYVVKDTITSERLLAIVDQAIQKSSLERKLARQRKQLSQMNKELSEVNEHLKGEVARRRLSEHRLRIAQFSLDRASDPIYWVAATANFQYVNEAACRALGYSRNELLSMTASDIDPHLPHEAWGHRWQKLQRLGSMNFESEHRHRDGSLIPVEISANYLKFNGDEYCCAFVRVITERKSMEAQLRHAHKLEAIGQLAAGIAHEINTPIQYVSDNARFLEDSFAEVIACVKEIEAAVTGVLPERVSRVPAAVIAALAKAELSYLEEEIPRAIEQSLDGISHVSRIVRSMKEFSHPAQEKTAVDINRAVENTITVARNEWKYLAEMTTDFDLDLAPVMCLPGEINQVLLNMVVNAAHAIGDAVGDGSGGKGTITVSTRGNDRCVEIRIADTGKGIPEEIRGRIFDPFFTTKEVGKGTGQGLHIAHNVIVGKHGGTISVESEVDKGTCFIIRLPVENVTSKADEVAV